MLIWANHDFWNIESGERAGPWVTVSIALPNCAHNVSSEPPLSFIWPESMPTSQLAPTAAGIMPPGTEELLLSCLVLEQAWQLHFSVETGGAAALSVTKYWAFIEYQLCTLCALLEPVLAYFIPASQWRAHRPSVPLSEKQKDGRLDHGYSANAGQVWAILCPGGLPAGPWW